MILLLTILKFKLVFYSHYNNLIITKDQKMSFMGFMSSPVSIPPVFDTTPCLEHLMEYEDCVIE